MHANFCQDLYEDDEGQRVAESVLRMQAIGGSMSDTSARKEKIGRIRCQEENKVPKNVKVRQSERGKDDLAVQTLLLRKIIKFQLKLT